MYVNDEQLKQYGNTSVKFVVYLNAFKGKSL